MSITHHDNLPVELSSFIGREREISEVEGLLADTRLLTLTGTGGCGKTRLALKVAGNLRERFEDGVWWVSLAPLTSPDLTPKSVASALGMHEQPGRSTTEALSDHLRFRDLILVLDNCEHLIEACAALAEALLLCCPNLKILATSREPLGVTGEATWPVPSLSLPTAHRRPPVEELVRYEAVRLFVERAAAARPDFAPTEHNAPVVVEVCRELDGIPLAIELAAARTKVLTIEQIAGRLGDSFRLLTGGSRTVLPRQRTLRATIEWSFELLPEEERTMFRRLSAFAGGFTLEATEEVCSGGGITEEGVFDLLSRLVDKSLIVTEERDGHARYRMLETVRQYGAEKLREAGELQVIQQRHADFFLAMAEEAEFGMVGPDQAAWLGRLEEEHDNVRAALGWLQEGDAEQGLRLASALLRFWWFRGHLAEGRARLEVLLELPGTSVRDEVRAKALRALGALIVRHADDAAGDWAVARSRLEEGLAIYRQLGDEPGIVAVLQDLGRVHVEQGNWTSGRACLGKSLEIGRRSDNEPGVALSHFQLGQAHFRRGELSRGRAHLEESIEMFRRLDDKFWFDACLVFLGYTDCEEGEYAAARARFLQMNETLPLIEFPWGATYTLEGFARLAAAQGQAARALRLAGATDALRRTYGVAIGPIGEAAFKRSIEPAWRALDEEKGKRPGKRAGR